jgi:hypothetical protein
VFLVVLIAALGLAAMNRMAIGDWVFFLQYHPDTETVKTADAIGLTPAGRRLFYRTNPQFVDTKAELTTPCGPHTLGCLTPRGQAFILDDPQKPGQTLATAAHEMLHLAYERLADSKKDELGPLIDQGIAQNDGPHLEAELGPDADEADRRDEGHSLLGTEYVHLPAGLETYYGGYFTDRAQLAQQASH